MPKIKAVEMFSKETAAAISAVAGDCLMDMDDEGARDAECMAEVAMDAGRLTSWGFPNADKEVAELIKVHGWPAVMKAAAKFVPTA